MVGQPFADFTWRAARQIVAGRGGDDTDETAVARALDDLLTRAGAGPGGDARHQRVGARTRAAARLIPSIPPADPEEPADVEEEDRDVPLAKVIPFGVFEPGDERRYR
ncbi:hypothetical protein O7626_09865 [Micromonospora sp. WMMD1102]|uniref:hypothetical protein n=1 Tax=Micromonospora sp. WMMD1102 TaxID=3016105 RepID=UPI0024156B75|nr:hypothetical protein [Micromonospora sp. WMMD1102]MDG4786229.1 hypothetical protein [Micromonospora sp. WMMD1102]